MCVASFAFDIQRNKSNKQLTQLLRFNIRKLDVFIYFNRIYSSKTYMVLGFI